METRRGSPGLASSLTVRARPGARGSSSRVGLGAGRGAEELLQGASLEPAPARGRAGEEPAWLCLRPAEGEHPAAAAPGLGGRAPILWGAPRRLPPPALKTGEALVRPELGWFVARLCCARGLRKGCARPRGDFLFSALPAVVCSPSLLDVSFPEGSVYRRAQGHAEAPCFHRRPAWGRPRRKQTAAAARQRREWESDGAHDASRSGRSFPDNWGAPAGLTKGWLTQEGAQQAQKHVHGVLV
ncbi:uncharacterized protein M6G45_011580 [Spheniscus humboldti]